MLEPRAYYWPEGDAFRSSEWTRGPWSIGHQHGGPPAALLARAIERFAAETGTFQVVRVTVEFFAPIPIEPLSITVDAIRSGGRTLTLAASLRTENREVCRAIGLCIRVSPITLPPSSTSDAPASAATSPIPPDEVGEALEIPFFTHPVGYHKTVAIRKVRGTYGQGPVTAWMAMRCVVVAGEIPSPLQRVMAVVDSGNGLSPVLDPSVYTFVNPDLTVHLHRLPATEWIKLEAVTTVHSNSIGMAECALSDESGSIGRSIQSLLIKQRK